MDDQRYLELVERFFEKAGIVFKKRGKDYPETSDNPSFILLDEGRKTYYLLEIISSQDVPGIEGLLKEHVEDYADTHGVDHHIMSMLASLGKNVHAARRHIPDDSISNDLQQKAALVVPEDTAPQLNDYLQSQNLDYQMVPFKGVFAIYLFNKKATEWFEEVYTDIVPQEKEFSAAPAAAAKQEKPAQETEIDKIAEPTPEQPAPVETVQENIPSSHTDGEDHFGDAGVQPTYLETIPYSSEGPDNIYPESADNMVETDDLAVKPDELRDIVINIGSIADEPSAVEDIFVGDMAEKATAMEPPVPVEKTTGTEIKPVPEEIDYADPDFSDTPEELQNIELPEIPDYIKETLDRYGKYSPEENDALISETLREDVDYPDFQNELELNAVPPIAHSEAPIGKVPEPENTPKTKEPIKAPRTAEPAKIEKTEIAEKRKDSTSEEGTKAPSIFPQTFSHIWSFIAFAPVYLLNLFTKGGVPKFVLYWIGGMLVLFGLYYYPLAKGLKPLVDVINTASGSLLGDLMSFWGAYTFDGISLFHLSLAMISINNMILKFMNTPYYLQYLLAFGYFIAMVPAWRTFAKQLISFFVVAYLLYLPAMLTGISAIKLISDRAAVSSVFTNPAEMPAGDAILSIYGSLGAILVVALLVPVVVIVFALRACRGKVDIL